MFNFPIFFLTIIIKILIRDFLQLLVNYVTCLLSNLSYFSFRGYHVNTVTLFKYIKSCSFVFQSPMNKASSEGANH